MGASQEPVAERRGSGNGGIIQTPQQPQASSTPTPPPPTRNPLQERAEFHLSGLNRLNPSNPLRVFINGGRFSRASTTPSPSFSHPPSATTPITPQQSVVTLSSRGYTNKIALILFLLHALASITLVGFLIFKGIQGILKGGNVKSKELQVLNHFLPQAEAASLLSIILAFSWQIALRKWPEFMVHFILWSSFGTTMAAAILLICFQKPSTTGFGVPLLLFSVGNGLYACWVNRRIEFCTEVLIRALEPASNFSDLNRPAYWVLGVGFVWISLWVLAVIGALNFYVPPLIILALVLSLAWTTEVMRNVVNLTVSRVIALYYLRGMQSNTKFCFQRALTRNLGSASLGSLFVPTIEGLRIVARGLNLLEGEDEFMFSCAHCCLDLMQSVFKFGNGWAYVQIAAYGKSFTRASMDTWELFQKHSREMEVIVDSDVTSAICFLSGVCSGSLCVIMVAAWSAKVHPHAFTATISLLAFFIGYLMTRIAMALPHACVSCYYVCYAENPGNRLYDSTIPDRVSMLRTGRDIPVPTPRVPRRFNA